MTDKNAEQDAIKLALTMIANEGFNFYPHGAEDCGPCLVKEAGDERKKKSLDEATTSFLISSGAVTEDTGFGPQTWPVTASEVLAGLDENTPS